MANCYEVSNSGSDDKESACKAGDPGKQVQSLDWEDPLKKETPTHSSIPAWEIPWTEEPGGLQSAGSQRVGHDRSNTHTHIHNIHTWSFKQKTLIFYTIP